MRRFVLYAFALCLCVGFALIGTGVVARLSATTKWTEPTDIVACPVLGVLGALFLLVSLFGGKRKG